MQKFAILTSYRTGSWNLVSTLDQHPDVTCHSEIFHEDYRRHILPCWLDFHDIAERDDPIRFVNSIFMSSEQAAVGFKIWRSQNPEATEYVLGSQDIRKIILERENVLARYTSTLLARRTGVWMRQRDAKLGYEVPELEFNEKAFMAMVDGHRALFQYYRDNAVGDIYEMRYEDVSAQRFQPLLVFLGVTPLPLQSRNRKLHSPDILARFRKDTHDDVRRALDRIGRPDWVFETLADGSETAEANPP